MRTAPLGVLFLGVAMMWVGCSVESSDDDDNGGESGEGGTGGTGSSGKSGKSGSSGTGGYADGGTAGSSQGKSGSGGSSAGTASGGYAGDDIVGGTSGGEGGWDSGTGGSVGGTYGGAGDGPGPAVGGEGGWPSKEDGGAGGEGPDPEAIVCDSEEPDSTPYPNCEPVDANNECEACVEQNCCEESQACFAFAPFNVCGWGGPNEEGEINCYVDCISEWLDENGACGQAALDACADECTTAACNEFGDKTWDLAVCMNENCSDYCFGGSCTIAN
ncbi:MAG TPA: hypothetical protein VGK73_36875 [Polyangiaceae bacterium]